MLVMSASAFLFFKKNKISYFLRVAIGAKDTLYCKDLSKKLKSALHTKWKQGVSTAGRVPFGYVKDKEDGHKWLIDPEAASYVRLIFDLALMGYTTKMIAEYLNEHDIPTPGQYRQQKTGHGAWFSFL